MASKNCSSYLLPLIVLLVLLTPGAELASAHDAAVLQLEGRGRMVGGRTDVGDVESNTEVQQLGLFCVEEHNRRQGVRLVFSKVVAAQTQVVSGIKYYLRIAARDAAGAGADERVFDAIVVVKAWLRSRVMVSFAPAVEQPHGRNRW